MKYFSVQGDKFLACPCCGLFNMTDEAQEKFDLTREYADMAIIVNSGCRCEKHNATLKNSSPTSSHIASDTIQSCALDVRAITDFCRYRILKGAIKAGITRILIYRYFIHLDTDSHKKTELIKLMF